MSDSRKPRCSWTLLFVNDFAGLNRNKLQSRKFAICERQKESRITKRNSNPFLSAALFANALYSRALIREEIPQFSRFRKREAVQLLIAVTL